MSEYAAATGSYPSSAAALRKERRLGVLERGLDVSLATAALPFALIMVAAIGSLLRLDGPGPVFFRQTRVGRRGRPFEILKLRTMIGPAEDGVAAAAPERIGRIGRLVRRAKLDELPQLLNVLRGEMALVGPRPEVPRFVEPAAGDDLLRSVRPGLVDRVSLVLADEERLLDRSSAPDRAYRLVLLPMKNDESRRDVASGTIGRWLAALSVLPYLVSRRRRAKSALRREALSSLARFELSEAAPAPGASPSPGDACGERRSVSSGLAGELSTGGRLAG